MQPGKTCGIQPASQLGVPIHTGCGNASAICCYVGINQTVRTCLYGLRARPIGVRCGLRNRAAHATAIKQAAEALLDCLNELSSCVCAWRISANRPWEAPDAPVIVRNKPNHSQGLRARHWECRPRICWLPWAHSYVPWVSGRCIPHWADKSLGCSIRLQTRGVAVSRCVSRCEDAAARAQRLVGSCELGTGRVGLLATSTAVCTSSGTMPGMEQLVS